VALSELGPNAHEAARRFLTAMIDADGRDGVQKLIARADRARPAQALRPAMACRAGPGSPADDAAAPAGGRRRPPHPRSVVALSLDRRLSHQYRRQRRDGGPAKLSSLSFDLLVLDVMMPGENGFEFARDIRKSSSVPILMLTARDAARAASPVLRAAPTIMSRNPSSRASYHCASPTFFKRAKPPSAPQAESVRFGTVPLSYRAR